MDDLVRLRNTGTEAVSFDDGAGLRVVLPGEEFVADVHAARILTRIAPIKVVPPPQPVAILIPAGARTAPEGAR